MLNSNCFKTFVFPLAKKNLELAIVTNIFCFSQLFPATITDFLKPCQVWHFLQILKLFSQRGENYTKSCLVNVTQKAIQISQALTDTQNVVYTIPDSSWEGPRHDCVTNGCPAVTWRYIDLLTRDLQCAKERNRAKVEWYLCSHVLQNKENFANEIASVLSNTSEWWVGKRPWAVFKT